MKSKIEFAHHDLGQVKSGAIVEVSLSGRAANVRLMNNTNYNNFKAGRKHSFKGGLVKRSPVHFRIPTSGHWHITVDMIGLRGNVRSSARILPTALPPVRQSQTVSSPLAPIIQNIATIPQEDDSVIVAKQYDVFISHASEDKDVIARPLAHKLRELGLQVWYDEFELRIGARLRRTIDYGLANSRFGVVVLSPNFFEKGWTNYELDGLVTREASGEQVILPLWHNLTRLELMKISPSLAGTLARSTSDYTIDEIATEIAMIVLAKNVEESEEWEEEDADRHGGEEQS